MSRNGARAAEIGSSRNGARAAEIGSSRPQVEAPELVVASVEVIVDDDDGDDAPAASDDAAPAVLDASGAAVDAADAAARLDGAVDASASTEDAPSAGAAVLRVLDVVLLVSERFFGTILPGLLDGFERALERASAALDDPLEPKNSQLLGGVKSTLPDDDREAGRRRGVQKLKAPSDDDAAGDKEPD